MADVGGGWHEKMDPSTGRMYYFNRTTQETSWTPPSSLPPDRQWHAKEHDGKTYYYNVLTNETTWTRPACLDNDDATVETETKVEPAIELEPTETMAAVQEKDEEEDDAMRLPKLIDKYRSAETLKKFGEAHFQLNRKGMFKGRTEIEKMLRWKNDVIKTALLNVQDKEFAGEAVQVFRNITGYMGDRGSGKDAKDHAVKLLTNLLQGSVELRNEGYCQLMKQLTDNPSEESTLKGWQLLALFLATFPPSDILEGPLGWFCTQYIEGDPRPGVGEFAKLCLLKLPRIVDLGARRELPTSLEIESTIRRDDVQFRVFFLDQKSLTVGINAWTTAKELAHIVSKKLGILHAAPFSIFEVCAAEDEERVLESDERPLDIVSYWHRVEKKTDFKFQYKVRHFFDNAVPDDDEPAIDLLYVQAKHDVIDSKYPCSRQDAVTLAALQLQEEFSDFHDATADFENLLLSKYLPENIIDPSNDLRSQLLTLYGKLKGYSQQEARLSYLDYVKAWKIYGSTYFLVEPRQNRDFPNNVVLAINAKGILVVDPDSKEFLQEFPYAHLVTWGHSSNSFVIVTGSAVNQVKAYFATEQGKEMNSMVHAYVEHFSSQQKKQAKK